jgi:hypothetical protein
MSATRSGGATGTLLRILVLSLIVLALFAATVLLVASLVAWRIDASITDPWSINLGILCGLIVWLFVVIFHIKAETLYVPVRRRGGYLTLVQGHLRELGYFIDKVDDSRVVARPGFHSYLMGGSIQVELEEGMARLVGPKIHLESLRRRLRMENVVEKAEQDIRDSQRRQGEKVLKRVAITLRVPLDQWNAIYDEVIDVLKKEDAEVVCELSVLATSRPGIRETIVDSMIRDWLAQHQIKADIHKEIHRESSATLPVLRGLGKPRSIEPSTSPEPSHDSAEPKVIGEPGATPSEPGA